MFAECLRKWPNFPSTDRVCTKPYTIEPINSDEKPIHLNVGENLMLPIYALQRDPQYFPNPERFDPERFNDENKHNINPYVYMPFGVGPRNCLGARFALLEIKSIFFNLIRNFEINISGRMQMPLKLSIDGVTVNAKDGFWLELKRINI